MANGLHHRNVPGRGSVGIILKHPAELTREPVSRRRLACQGDRRHDMSERVSSKLHTSELSAAETSARNWQPLGTFHHVGFIVPSILAVVHSFAESLQAEWDGNIIHDLNQDVRVTFLRSRFEGDPLFELVEPASEKSPVNSFLKRGGGLNHVCYIVESLETQLELCRSQGALVVRNPLPAAAFGGRRIAWVYTKHKLLIEYLERK